MMRNIKYPISNIKCPMWLPHLTLVVFGIGMYLTFVFTANALYQPWIAEQAANSQTDQGIKNIGVKGFTTYYCRHLINY